MNVYDFAPDLDLSKEVEGSIFRVRGIEGGNGIVYAKVVVFTDYRNCSCERCVFYDCYKDVCLLWGSDSCVDENEFCVYEQAAIEGQQAAPWTKACGCRQGVGQSRAGTVYCGT